MNGMTIMMYCMVMFFCGVFCGWMVHSVITAKSCKRLEDKKNIEIKELKNKLEKSLEENEFLKYCNHDVSKLYSVKTHKLHRALYKACVNWFICKELLIDRDGEHNKALKFARAERRCYKLINKWSDTWISKKST